MSASHQEELLVKEAFASLFPGQGGSLARQARKVMGKKGWNRPCCLGNNEWFYSQADPLFSACREVLKEAAEYAAMLACNAEREASWFRRYGASATNPYAKRRDSEEAEEALLLAIMEGPLCPPVSPTTVGVEVEVESRGLLPMDPFGWKTVRDGSLQGGMEYVSPILQANEAPYQTGRILQTLAPVATGDYTCGLHVHIGHPGDIDQVTLAQEEAFLAMLHSGELEARFPLVLKGRKGNRYCTWTPSLEYDRYTAVNLYCAHRAHGTIEVRVGGIPGEITQEYVRQAAAWVAFCAQHFAQNEWVNDELGEMNTLGQAYGEGGVRLPFTLTPWEEKIKEVYLSSPLEFLWILPEVSFEALVVQMPVLAKAFQCIGQEARNILLASSDEELIKTARILRAETADRRNSL